MTQFTDIVMALEEAEFCARTEECAYAVCAFTEHGRLYVVPLSEAENNTRMRILEIVRDGVKSDVSNATR